MESHHQHRIALLQAVKVGIERNLLKEARKLGAVRRVLIFYKVGFELADILKPGFTLYPLSTEHFGIARFFAEQVKKALCFKILRRVGKLFYHIGKFHQSSGPL